VEVLVTRSWVRATALRFGSPTGSWLLAAAFWGLYLLTSARVVQGGDSGEFVVVAAGGGVAHPSGYPLFSALAALAVKGLPLGTAAWRVAALSSLLGAATIGVVHRAVLRATEDGFAACSAACALGFSVLFWRWSVVPEVLSGSTLTAALVLLVCVGSARGARGPRQGLLLGLAFATGIAHHHTAILLAPLLAWGFFAALPRPLGARTALPVLGAAIGGSLVGLLPYLLLLLPGGAWRWGETTELSGLVHHFLRADYGTFDTGQASRGIPLMEQPLLSLDSTLRQFPGGLAPLAVLGLGLAFVARTGRGFAAALLATWLLAGPLFVTRFDLPAEGYYRVVVERFHSFPNILLVAGLGFGVAWLRRLELWSRPAVPVGLVVLNLAVAGALAGPRASMHGATVLDDFLRNTLGAVEPDAVVITKGDSFHFGCLHAQEVDGLRPDVACVHPRMLGYSWYRARLLRAHPDLVLELDGRALPLPELAAANAELRPVYLSVRIPLVSPEVVGVIPPSWPAAGTLLRVSGPGESPPPPQEVEARLLADYEQFVFRSRIHDVEELGESLEAPAWDHYGLVWNTLASGYAFLGDEAGRQRCEARVRELSPWLLESDSVGSP